MSYDELKLEILATHERLSCEFWLATLDKIRLCKRKRRNSTVIITGIWLTGFVFSLIGKSQPYWKVGYLGMALMAGWTNWHSWNAMIEAYRMSKRFWANTRDMARKEMKRIREEK